MRGDPHTVAYVSARHGAYLIMWAGPRTDDMTPDDLFDVESNGRRARAYALEGAKDIGYVAPFKWETRSSTQWLLNGHDPDDARYTPTVPT